MRKISGKKRRARMGAGVYFIGIGGIGMSSLARWFKAQKWPVSGSDLTKSEITQELKKDGFRVKIGHKKSNLGPKIGLIIHSQAVKPDNPEIIEARHRKIPVLSYPEAVGELTKKYKTMAIAGAHGKSTTTALTAIVLQNGGLDPTVIIGTKLKQFAPPAGGSNFRSGKSRWLVLEADEYGNAFSHYSPFAAIVTNVDREHLDTYGNLTRVKKAFLNFLSNASPDGIFILNHDDKNLFSLKNKIARIAARKRIKTVWYSTKNALLSAKIKKHLQIPGAHNLFNALAAYHLGKVLRIPEEKILSALGSYRGAWRRMEYKGFFRQSISNRFREYSRINSKKIRDIKVLVYDDYAHHPTEIKATLQAFREKFPKQKLICVFQPHQAERLKQLFKDFTEAFRDADCLILLPAYQVAGRDRTYKQFTSEKLARAINLRNLKLGIRNSVCYLPHPARLKSFLQKSVLFPRKSASSPHESATSAAALVMMGAGDIVKYTEKLLS